MNKFLTIIVGILFFTGLAVAEPPDGKGKPDKPDGGGDPFVVAPGNVASKPVVPQQTTYTVEALEEVTVPAGTFKAYKVVATDDVGRGVSERWVVPTLGLFGDFSVKGSDERRAAVVLGPGRREWTLVARTPPRP